VKNFQKVCKTVALVSIGLILSLSFFAACSDDPAPAPEPIKGVVGQLSGVVVDSVTLLPIADVDVKLTGTNETVKTDAVGSFRFEDVTIGEQVLTLSKAGYQFGTKNVEVLPGDYKTDDPFAQYEALQAQLEALLASAGGVVTIGGPQGGDTFEISLASDGLYEVRKIELEYSYSKFMFYAVELLPLKGKLDLTINVVQAFNQAPSHTLVPGNFAAIQNDVEVWFTNSNSPDFAGSTDELGSGGKEYGPYKTAGGKLTVSDLPYGIQLTPVINAFTQGGFTYNSSTLYEWNGSSFTSINVSAGYDEAKDYTVYLFATAGYAYVTAYSAGSFATPIARTDSVTITYSEEINPVGFTSTINAGPVSQQTLDQTWSQDGKTVTLKHSTGSFPYNPNGTNGITLTYSGTTKSGVPILNSTTPIRIFTPEGLKLSGVNVAPASSGIPARVATSATAVQLTFSKPLSANSRFAFGTALPGTPAAWNFASATNTSVVYVYTDILTTNDIAFEAIAEADPFDKVTGNTNSFLGEQISKQAAQLLTLKRTSLWDIDALTAPITAASASYSIGSGAHPATFTITFDQVVPGNADVVITLTNNQTFATVASTTASGKGTNTLTIQPGDGITANTGANTHTLSISIQAADGTYIFQNSRLTAYNGNTINGGATGIIFRVGS